MNLLSGSRELMPSTTVTYSSIESLQPQRTSSKTLTWPISVARAVLALTFASTQVQQGCLRSLVLLLLRMHVLDQIRAAGMLAEAHSSTAQLAELAHRWTLATRGERCVGDLISSAV